jgi:hypothetical protein
MTNAKKAAALPPMLTIQDAADSFDLSPKTIRRWLAAVRPMGGVA